MPVAFLALAMVWTWPLARYFSSRIGGDLGDRYQDLWNFWHVKEAVLGQRESLLHTHALWHPEGVGLAQQTMNWPSALLALPLWSILSPAAIMNTILLWSFTAAGWFSYLLLRALEAPRRAAFIAGCLYTFGPFHMAHAMGSMHLAEIEWTPLYLFALLRLIDRPRWSTAAWTGGALALVGATSWHHLVMSFTATLFLLGWMLWHPERRAQLLRWRLWRCLSLTVAIGAAVIAPLFCALLLERGDTAGEPHDASINSADLQALAFPGDQQLLARWIQQPGFTSQDPIHPDAMRRRSFGTRDAHGWAGNSSYNGSYPGWIALALATLGARRRSRARPFFAAAIIGLLVALGPELRVGGAVVWSGLMPYDLLEAGVPLLGWSGTPIAWSGLSALGIAVAAGLGLVVLLERAGPRRRRRWLALGAGAFAVLEFAPRPFVTSQIAVAAPFDSWSRDPEPWAVLDVSGGVRGLWNNMHHGHPQIGGYLSRDPQHLLDRLGELPLLESAVFWPRYAWGVVVAAPTSALGALPTSSASARVEAVWHATLSVDRGGVYEARLTGRGYGWLGIDDKIVARLGGPALGGDAAIELAAGPHRLVLFYQSLGADPELRAQWRAAGGDWAPLPVEPIASGGSAPGVERWLRAQVTSTGLSRTALRQQLRAFDIRYVIVPAQWRDHRIEVEAALPLVFEGDGLRIYSVPGEGAP